MLLRHLSHARQGAVRSISCEWISNSKLGSVVAPEHCDTYPDRLFDLGGLDSTRGYYSLDTLIDLGLNVSRYRERREFNIGRF